MIWIAAAGYAIKLPFNNKLLGSVPWMLPLKQDLEIGDSGTCRCCCISTPKLGGSGGMPPPLPPGNSNFYTLRLFLVASETVSDTKYNSLTRKWRCNKQFKTKYLLVGVYVGYAWQIH